MLARRMKYTLAGAVALSGLTVWTPTFSQTPTDACPERPYLYVRHEENTADYADPSCRRDALDRLRYIDLDPFTLSVGGEVRLRFERLDPGLYANPAGDAFSLSDGAFFSRAYLFGELDWQERARLFVTLRASDVDGADGTPRTVDEGGVDLQEAFIEIGARDVFSVRLGRQEISYPLAPPSRLLSARDGLNVRRTWDAARAIWRLSDTDRVDAFYAQLVEPIEGNFNDEALDVELWGAYGTLALAQSMSVDPYYYGLVDEIPPFPGAVGTERRHTIGARLHGAIDDWAVDYDIEGAFQFGEIGDDPCARASPRSMSATRSPGRGSPGSASAFTAPRGTTTPMMGG